MIVRTAGSADDHAVWAILEPVIGAGETYTLPRGWNQQQTLTFWFSPGHTVFVAEEDGQILGTYFLKANQMGGGSQVANCGYVTATWASGRGVARVMCAHSLEYAQNAGFRAMQFNFVLSSNERAVRLWQSFGFEIVGHLPGAFLHPSLGYVDAFVMYRGL
jgi:ribosomal protein S18 acetylase RimI-like enzyme